MKRIKQMAQSFDAREPSIPRFVKPNVIVVNDYRWATKDDAFWEKVRADYCWLSESEMAVRYRVAVVTINRWLHEAFRGRP